ncbi:hypothetical protein TNCV_3534211 [Trichonephila clavipes]|nr:hypothetical protein TNCV_3534211 [Trichonephila clavipes]
MRQPSGSGPQLMDAVDESRLLDLVLQKTYRVERQVPVKSVEAQSTPVATMQNFGEGQEPSLLPWFKITGSSAKLRKTTTEEEEEDGDEEEDEEEQKGERERWRERKIRAWNTFGSNKLKGNCSWAEVLEDGTGGTVDNFVALHLKYDQARRRFVEWAQNEIAVVPDFHKRNLFSDEAHFWLKGYVNKQNCRIWSEANPQVYVETPLHPEKLTVWCALWAGGILLQKR